MSDNFEVHDRATELSDTMTPYALARRVVELEEAQNKIKAEAVIEAANKVIRHNECGFCIHCELIEHANKLKRGEV